MQKYKERKWGQMRCWFTCNKRWVSGDGFSSERITWLSVQTRSPVARWRPIGQGCAKLLGALICPLIHCSFYSQGWKVFGVSGSLEKHVLPPPWLLEADKLNATGRSQEGPPSNFSARLRKAGTEFQSSFSLCFLLGADLLTFQSLLLKHGANSNHITQLVPG